MPKFKINLNEKDIGELIKDIDRYKRDLKYKIDELIATLVGTGVSIAKIVIQEMGANYTGELVESIEGFFDSTTGIGIIKAGAPYAVYVEFGTGVVGKSQPPPHLPEGWTYDVNEHGDDGWWYLNDNTGRMQWTKGMVGRPFMFNTAQLLEMEVAKLAKEVFNR